MTSKIGIGIDAQLDTAAVEAKINALGQKIAQANRTQFTPFSKSSLADIDRVVRQFEQLRKVNGDLNRRMNATGQGKAGLADVDWDKLYPDQHSRARQMRKAFEYSTGSQFAPRPGDPRPPGDEPPRRGPSFGGMVGNVAQAGLRAAGPVGGVAANALGTGMASGAGAGLMGLMGGMVALGVGKFVSAAMDKVGEAENNNVALDKLKRTIGDVSVSFNALKAVVNGSGENLKITYSEAGQLATQFVKLGNVTSEQYKTISSELGVGVGLSRSFGMDPAQGVGVMGQMRGVGATSNTQDSRRFALLIGETIGKSGAFSKADEVMESLASYTMSQTRNNMGAANTAGYAGAFSGLVSSGIPGMDPSGASSLLSRINASLSGGGAKGEASQFFTGSIGASMGLNPYQTRMLRETGAFGTAGKTFGKDSVYSRYKGGATGPGGNTTFLEATLGKLRGQYGEGSDELADATANHLGIGINQAMGLLSVKPKQMGELSGKFGNLLNFNGAGIGNLVKNEYGTAADRKAIAGDYLGRKGSDKISDKDRDAINGASTDDALKKVLSDLALKYDQERTIGSDTRDSKNILDNIKTNMADKLVPYMNDMRHGIMYLAGAKDGKSPREIIEDVLRAEGKDKLKSVSDQFGSKKNVSQAELDSIQKQKENLKLENRKQYGKFTTNQGEYERQMKELTDREAVLLEANNKAKQAYTDAMKKATQELEDSITDTRKGLAPGTTGSERAARGGGGGGASSGAGAGSGASALASSLSDVKDPEQRKNLGAFLDTLGTSEGANYNSLVGKGKFNNAIPDLGAHPNKVGMRTADGPSTAAGKYQITGTTWKSLSHGGKSDFSPESQDKAAIELLKRRGAYDDVLAGRWDAAVAKLGDEWQSLPSGTSKNQGKNSTKAFYEQLEAAKQRQGTALPDGAGSRPGDKNMLGGEGGAMTGNMSLRLDLSPTALRLLQPPQAPVSGNFSRAKPFGSGATGSW